MKASNLLKRAPVPTNWTKPQCAKWLQDNPISNRSCVEWIRNTEQQYFNIVTSMLASKKAQASESNGQSTAWRTIEPWLRLYEAAADDNAKQAFLCKDDTLDRRELDARNHKDRPKTYHELLQQIK